MKKVQPKGVGLRCEIHRRNGGQATSEGWEWEDAWDRLPADMRLKVAAIDVDALEAAMHQATSTHRWELWRFCGSGVVLVVRLSCWCWACGVRSGRSSPAKREGALSR